jgi:hypothetical protein
MKVVESTLAGLLYYPGRAELGIMACALQRDSTSNVLNITLEWS